MDIGESSSDRGPRVYDGSLAGFLFGSIPRTGYRGGTNAPV
ncbi:MAG: hypothetical protein QOD27_1793 [Microbacteriaceae bacterium]|jgi:hypothetical protein|nr:hypothetical protein [Microbacteriaceae bacterium]MDQ1550135.1 hypothetical protein [Microbacteriaceae bacterium]